MKKTLSKLLLSLVVTLLFFGLLEWILFLLDLPRADFTDPLVGFSSAEPLFRETARNGTTWLVTRKAKLPFFNYQKFARLKKAGTYRIFCLGGSLTFGRPFDDRTSFAGWLRTLLPLANRSRDWEVINAGGISYASYRVAMVMQELCNYDPDLFIIYTGHNEFLEQRTYGKFKRLTRLGGDRFVGGLFRLRTVRGLGQMLGGQSKTIDSREKTILPGEVKAVLDESITQDYYERDDARRDKILRHYHLNLERMVAMARAAGADVILVTPASNLGSCAPFKSVFDKDRFPPQVQREWYFHYRKALVSEGHEALESMRHAALIDERCADVQYRYAEMLQQQGNQEEALCAFTRARDEDVCPLRATSAMIDMVRRTARACKAPLLDFVRFLENRSPYRILNEHYFIDHVHLTIEGNRLLARQLMELMHERGWLSYGPQWTDAAIMELVRRKEAELDKKDQARALVNLAKVLGWSGKIKESYVLALKAAALDDTMVEAHYLVGQGAMNLGDSQCAMAAFQRTLELNPNTVDAKANLGLLLNDQRRYEEAAAYLESVVASRGKEWRDHNNLGLAYMNMKRPDKAIVHFNRTLALNPKCADAHYNLGLLYERQGAATNALSHYDKALALRPKWATAVNKTAWLLLQLGRDTPHALHLALQLNAETRNTQPSLLRTLAAAFAADGQFDKAVPTAQRALGKAQSLGQPALAKALRADLERYRERKTLFGLE